jgi:homoserine kinase
MSVIVRVPATTANLGAGFDCIGAALSLYNQFKFSAATELTIVASGPEADRVDKSAANLAYQAFAKLFDYRQQPVPPVKIELELGIPLARGLGSSATAIVGGLLGANVWAGSPCNATTLLQLAIEMEGHPDNVVPALMGGCRLAATQGAAWEICDIDWHPDVIPVIAIPNFELSTAAARQVLPASYSRADAVFNIAHLGMMLRGLATGNANWLQTGLADRIHQPYRQALIPGYAAVEQAAIAAGAHGLVISGAGPTLLALAPPQRAAAVAAAMQDAWTQLGIQPQVQALSIDLRGAQILNSQISYLY